MRVLITYSSKTGNTQRLAEAIHLALPNADLCPINSAPNLTGYDLIYTGFWVEAGTANEEMRSFMEKLQNQKIAMFATLGAYPDSLHAKESMDAAGLLMPSCNIIGRHICQGAIDHSMIKWMEQLPPNHESAPTESRRKLWKDAASHPNEADLKNAADWALGILKKASA